jgi:hypothetical protein
MVNIYKILHPETLEIRYVGKTVESLKKRLEKHIYNKSNNTKIAKWLRKLISEGKKPIIELIEQCDDSVWQEREIFWISFYSKTCNLMNTSPGGDLGNLGMHHSEESKRKIGLANSKPKSQDWINNAATAMKKFKSRKIVQFDKKMNIINVWQSFYVAAIVLFENNYKNSIKNMHSCANGGRKSAYGYIWRYIEDTELKDKELLG